MTAQFVGLLAVYLAVLLAIAPLLGRYIRIAVEDGQSRLTAWGRPLERGIYRLAGIDPRAEMGWKRYASAVLAFNIVGIAAVYGLQRVQGWLPLNPAGLGAVSQLCGMLLQESLGAQFTTVPYAGTAPALTALLGGQIDVLCDQTTQPIPHIKADRVKLYGVTTLDRIQALPDTPTLQESGLKGFEVKVWHGVYAPKGTPPEAIAKVNAALRAALKDPAFTQKMTELGAEIVPESKQTPEGLQTWLQTEVDKWGGIIRKAGVYAD